MNIYHSIFSLKFLICFRGAAHNKCNLEYQLSRTIPVVFHNLSGYDSHLFIKELVTSTILPGSVSVIPLNKERYISFTKYTTTIPTVSGKRKNPKNAISFRFIDSFRFMASSLDKLASYLTDLPILTKQFQKDSYTSHQIQLLQRKGVFPYEYISSFDKLKETQLPTHEDFFSSLNDSNVSEADFQHAKQVWKDLLIKSLGEYSDLYLKTDVLLLADVFEAYIEVVKRIYGIDPANYFTFPGNSFLTYILKLK